MVPVDPDLPVLADATVVTRGPSEHLLASVLSFVVQPGDDVRCRKYGEQTFIYGEGSLSETCSRDVDIFLTEPWNLLGDEQSGM